MWPSPLPIKCSAFLIFCFGFDQWNGGEGREEFFPASQYIFINIFSFPTNEFLSIAKRAYSIFSAPNAVFFPLIICWAGNP